MTSSLSLGITTYPGTVKIKTQSLHVGIVGEHYSTVLRAVGGSLPYTWQMVHGSNLPPGLVLNATTGKITGTPSNIGTFGFTVKVMDVARSIRKKTFSITIS
jgi:hypothetical protein